MYIKLSLFYMAYLYIHNYILEFIFYYVYYKNGILKFIRVWYKLETKNLNEPKVLKKLHVNNVEDIPIVGLGYIFVYLVKIESSISYFNKLTN